MVRNFKLCVLAFLWFGLLQAQITIKMEKQGGVFTVPCKVNGLPLRFIFDTGASGVTISLEEAKFMAKHGQLNTEDILWPKGYQTANGEVSVGLDIILREVEFGGITLKNVVASIIEGDDVPLLLGQSVLSRIGQFQVDPIQSILTIVPSSGNFNGSILTDIDGNQYKTVRLGQQRWMADNLKTSRFANGEDIPFIKASNEWAAIDYSAYSYYELDPQYQRSYGNLYNWYAIVDQRGICPFGWHIPSLSEVRELEAYMNRIGISTSALKSNGADWTTPNFEAQNHEGFNAKPGGKRWYSNGNFEFINKGGYFWTSSSAGNFRAYYYAFAHDYTEAKMHNFLWGDGFSCRCIQD
jgi:clan AA aspartic protease (TIGR02281 family)